ncbi:MAG: hypothetical protein IPM60_14445 [Rhodospirillales bacterium]|nr:hypothetical protein [Rhodospirillales bacterium]
MVETVTEHPAFAGTRTDCVVDAGDLILDSDAGGVLPEGTYDFANAVDLGAVYTSRITGRIKVLGENVDNLVKHWARLADVENLSGAEPGQYNAWLELRTTDDDPAGTPTWSAWRPLVIGDVTARAYEFRAQLRSTSTAVTPRIDELSATVDMPDRTDGAHDVACPAGGVAIAFSPAFRATPAIAVSGQDMATGDVVEVTGQSAGGFTVRFKNSAGAGVARTFDWVARGYGHQQAA